MSEKAISNLLKMTDDDFAFRTLRIPAQDAREVLDSLLLSSKTPVLIRYFHEISLFKVEKKQYLNQLEKKIGSKRLHEAINWEKKLDPLYNGPVPSDAILHDVFLFNDALEKDFESQEDTCMQKQLAKYQLFKTFQTIIDELYPD